MELLIIRLWRKDLRLGRLKRNLFAFVKEQIGWINISTARRLTFSQLAGHSQNSDRNQVKMYCTSLARETHLREKHRNFQLDFPNQTLGRFAVLQWNCTERTLNTRLVEDQRTANCKECRKHERFASGFDRIQNFSRLSRACSVLSIEEQCFGRLTPLQMLPL